jgi:hypothetical protein
VATKEQERVIDEVLYDLTSKPSSRWESVRQRLIDLVDAAKAEGYAEAVADALDADADGAF